MKTAIKLIAAALLLLIAAHTGWQIGRAQEPSTYPLSTTVVMVDYDTDTVTCRDYNGNLWSFHGCEDWMPADIAALLMDDQGTPLIYDDTVLSARYSGYID